jgi:hypothetical protein
MIVHDLNFKRVAFIPAKADPPLVIDSNTVLTSPIAGQGGMRLTQCGMVWQMLQPRAPPPVIK